MINKFAHIMDHEAVLFFHNPDPDCREVIFGADRHFISFFNENMAPFGVILTDSFDTQSFMDKMLA